jgi:predicted Na+-dependent transporter
VTGIDGVIVQRARLAGLAGFLDRFLLYLVLAAAGLGVVLPSPGRLLDTHGAILITLAVLVFCTGSSVTFGEFFTGVRAASRRMALALALTTVTLPMLAWLASRLVSEPTLRGGVLAAGVAPVEVASVALTGLAGGEVAVAAGLLVASTLLTVVLAGPILGLLGAHTAMSQLGLLATLALVVALPLLAGGAMRTLDPFGGRERSLIDIVGIVCLLALLWEIASELRLQASDGLVAVALLAYLAGAGALGWLLARGAPARRRTAFILPTAMRDFAVAAGIAASAFGIAAAAPLGIYGVMVLIFGAIAVTRSKRP